MKTKFITLAAFALACSFSFAQNIGIGTSTPNPSAILDISSTTKGILFPRMDSSQRKAIVNPSQGLMVVQKDLLYVYSGKTWGYFAANKNQAIAVNSNAVNWDCAQGLNANVILTDDATLNIQNMVQGMIGIIAIRQDERGNKRINLPAGSKVSGGGGGNLTLSAEPGAIDIVSFYYDGETFYWNMKSNFN